MKKHVTAIAFLALAMIALASAANNAESQDNYFSINDVQMSVSAPSEARQNDLIPVQIKLVNKNALDAAGRLDLLDDDNAAIDYSNVLLKGNTESTSSFEVNLSKIMSAAPVFTARLKIGDKIISNKVTILISEENVLLQVFTDKNTPVNNEQELTGIENIRVRVNTLNKTLVRLVVIRVLNTIIFQKNLVESEYSASIALGVSGDYEILVGEIAEDKSIQRKSIKFSANNPVKEEEKTASDWNIATGLIALVFLLVIFVLFKQHGERKTLRNPTKTIDEHDERKFFSKSHRQLLEKWRKEDK